MRTLQRLVVTAIVGVAALLSTSALASGYVEKAPLLAGGGVDAKYANPAPGIDPNENYTPTDVTTTTPKGPTTNAVSNRRYMFANQNGPTSLLRNDASGYVIGSALNGWTFDLTNKSPSGNWFRGYAYANHNNCAFAFVNNVDFNNTSGHSACPEGWVGAVSDFANSVNCSDCNGGYGVRLVSQVNRFLNVGAYGNGGNGPYADNQGILPGGTCVQWRYTTKNNYWVLARWPGADDNHGAWAYMERGAFPATLPNSSQC